MEKSETEPGRIGRNPVSRPFRPRLNITNGRVFGGPRPNILIFWLFLNNLSVSGQTIDRALIIHTEQ